MTQAGPTIESSKAQTPSFQTLNRTQTLWSFQRSWSPPFTTACYIVMSERCRSQQFKSVFTKVDLNILLALERMRFWLFPKWKTLQCELRDCYRDSSPLTKRRIYKSSLACSIDPDDREIASILWFQRKTTWPMLSPSIPQQYVSCYGTHPNSSVKLHFDQQNIQTEVQHELCRSCKIPLVQRIQELDAALIE